MALINQIIYNVTTTLYIPNTFVIVEPAGSPEQVRVARKKKARATQHRLLRRQIVIQQDQKS